MTGDGKSLAAYLDSAGTHYSAIGLYPTQRDQEGNANSGVYRAISAFRETVFPAEWAGVRNLCRN